MLCSSLEHLDVRYCPLAISVFPHITRLEVLQALAIGGSITREQVTTAGINKNTCIKWGSGACRRLGKQHTTSTHQAHGKDDDIRRHHTGQRCKLVPLKLMLTHVVVWWCSSERTLLGRVQLVSVHSAMHRSCARMCMPECPRVKHSPRLFSMRVRLFTSASCCVSVVSVCE